jgi:hypothetical protein
MNVQLIIIDEYFILSKKKKKTKYHQSITDLYGKDPKKKREICTTFNHDPHEN